MKARMRWVWAFLLVTLVMVGCRSPEAKPEVIGKAAETVAAKTVATDAKPEDSESEEVLVYDQTNKLDSLDSYRFKNTISFKEEGGDGGTVEMEVEFVRDPEAQRMLIRNFGESSDDIGEIELIRIGGDSYARVEDNEWMSMQIPAEDLFPDSTMVYQPENVFEGARGRYVGTETVNGIKTKHYVYDKEALAKSGLFESLLTASGEVWVSVQDNVVVRAMAQLEGKDETTEEMVTVQIQSEIWDVNADITIAPPEGVNRAETPGDIPVMEGARELVVMQQMTSYKVDKNVDDVKAFYEEQMEANGWKAETSMVPGFMTYAKDERTVQIIIQEQGEQTGVAIVLPEE